MNDSEKEESFTKASKVQPGDLILIRTPSKVYEAMRKLSHSDFDHIVSACPAMKSN